MAPVSMSEEFDEATALASKIAEERGESNPGTHHGREEELVGDGGDDGDAMVELEDGGRELAGAGGGAEGGAGGGQARDPRGDGLLGTGRTDMLDDQAVPAKQDQMIDTTVFAKPMECRVEFRHSMLSVKAGHPGSGLPWRGVRSASSGPSGGGEACPHRVGAS